MSALKELQRWYSSHCDGDWEHTYGIKIGTLDNPGWSIQIDLEETELEGRPYERLEIEREEHNWLHCWIEENRFNVRCGPLNLEEGIEIFLRWVQESQST